jgi:hypothetical protein
VVPPRQQILFFLFGFFFFSVSQLMIIKRSTSRRLWGSLSFSTALVLVMVKSVLAYCTVPESHAKKNGNADVPGHPVPHPKKKMGEGGIGTGGI